MDPDFLVTVNAVAAGAGYTQNSFINACCEGIVEMINTPEGKAIEEPRVVAVARFIKRHKPETIKVIA